MINTLQGDPRLILTEDGSDLLFKSGQPVTDKGLENLALISLFSGPGWCGNSLFSDPAQKIGSDFESAVNQPITLSALNEIRDAALKALDNQIFGNVSVTVNNPTNNRLDIIATIEPPGQDIKQLIVSKNGLNWVAQINDPVNTRI